MSIERDWQQQFEQISSSFSKASDFDEYHKKLLKDIEALHIFQKLGLIDIFQKTAQELAISFPDTKIRLYPNPEIYVKTLELTWDSQKRSNYLTQHEILCKYYEDHEYKNLTFFRNECPIAKGTSNYVVLQNTRATIPEKFIPTDIGFSARIKKALKAAQTAEVNHKSASSRSINYYFREIIY